MKKMGLMALGLMLGATSAADAQLQMQMGNGWTFGFAGNVNVFYIYSDATERSDVTGGLLTARKESAIGSGLLPAFATLTANGKEGNTNLGVTFGFAPQVSMGTGTASNFGDQAAGAQIDMRQVFLTVGGDWGQVLAGKQLGIYQRQNLIQDMTIFGLGTNIGTRGTSLGRIGYGYEYTDFRGQIAYSTKAGKPATFTIGITEPTNIGGREVRQTPRLESELLYSKKSGNTTFGFNVSGMLQNVKSDVSTEGSATATGIAGGFNFDVNGFKFVANGFTSRGLGGIFQGGNTPGLEERDNGDLRTTYGYYGQATYTPKNSKVTLGYSYGDVRTKLGAEESATGNELVRSRSSHIGMISYQVTKSYRVLGEYTYSADKNHAGDPSNRQHQVGLGMMLFY